VRETPLNGLLFRQRKKKKTVGGPRGINTPQIQNSNGHISEFRTFEKNLGTSDL
jgi:hypothetical protein